MRGNLIVMFVTAVCFFFPLLFFLSRKYWLVLLHYYKNSPPISKSWIRACPRPLIKFLSFPFSVDFSYFSFLYSLVGSSYAQKLHGHVTLKIWVPRFILHVHHATLIFPGVIFGIYFMGECHKCTGSSTSCKLHWNVQLNLYYTYTILHWIATVHLSLALSTDHLSLVLIFCAHCWSSIPSTDYLSLVPIVCP